MAFTLTGSQLSWTPVGDFGLLVLSTVTLFEEVTCNENQFNMYVYLAIVCRYSKWNKYQKLNKLLNICMIYVYIGAKDQIIVMVCFLLVLVRGPTTEGVGTLL